MYVHQKLITEPQPISNLRARATNNSTLTVQWLAPVKPNGVILSYTVAVYEVNESCNDAGKFKQSAITGPVLQHNVTQLGKC